MVSYENKGRFQELELKDEGIIAEISKIAKKITIDCKKWRSIRY